MNPRITSSHLSKPLVLLALGLLLAGCGNSDEQEVRAWMKQVDAQARVAVPPLAEPKNFIPFAYGQSGTVDPFNPNKLLDELARSSAREGKGLKPDMERRKEYLEGFPLDTMKMVGTIQQRGVYHAILQIDRSVHHVVAGQHLGQNFGLITSINDSTVVIKEIVQDAAGDWVERISKLELQESKETSK